MRNFSSLFKLKEYNPFEVILIGFDKFIFTKVSSYKEINTIINLTKVDDYIILMVDNIDDIYMYEDDIFTLAKNFIIIYK